MSEKSQESSKNTHKNSKIAQEVEEQLTEMRTSVVNYVKKNPFKAIGMSLLAGAIVAQLLRKNKD
jgi:ElaB/YqjD/DUF883 family membrane-anchored ribosome-binding protein